MLKYRDKIRHFYQEGAYNCGPVALQCLFDSSVEELERIVGCKKGTYWYNVLDGMRQQGISCNAVELNQDHKDHLWWIKSLSFRFPIYAGCQFVNQGARGRPANSHHAVLFAGGFYYDGNNHREEPIEGIATLFNKTFRINNIIVFEREIDGWQEKLMEE